jgi:hypothetical protein
MHWLTRSSSQPFIYIPRSLRLYKIFIKEDTYRSPGAVSSNAILNFLVVYGAFVETLFSTLHLQLASIIIFYTSTVARATATAGPPASTPTTS